MLEKLQIIQQRFDEVSDLIIQPDIIADQKRYIQLNKEYKDLNILVEKGNSTKHFYPIKKRHWKSSKRPAMRRW